MRGTAAQKSFHPRGGRRKILGEKFPEDHECRQQKKARGEK
jgi:hypothetical protein